MRRRMRKGVSQKRNGPMPVLARFYGIVIRMLFLRQFVAHFHAFYENNELVVGLSPVRILQGEAPDRVRAMVLEWPRPTNANCWRPGAGSAPPCRRSRLNR